MVSLYRKYRPQKFLELNGQEHVKRTLMNALIQGKVGHGYLFAGPRGTGKTTVARLLAKAVNCKRQAIRDRRQAEPCDECARCNEIRESRSFDVLEIDAASNRGIDEIRELREKIRFKPTSAPYKVFIIDEAHMLTKEAFNALLKTLEEPPSHAIFILATTEVHKLPLTILSRVQRFDFRRANKDDLIQYLGRIIEGERIKIAPDAIELIAELGDGSFRDAASFLEQLMHSVENKEEISFDIAQNNLGIVSQIETDKMLEAIFNDRQKEALEIIDRLYSGGHSLEYFCEALINNLRQKHLFSAKDPHKISSIIEIFLMARDKIKTSPIPQLPLELAIINLTNPNPSRSKIVISEIDNIAPQIVRAKEAKKEASKEAARINRLEGETWQNLLQAVKPYNHSLCGLLRECYPLGIEGDEFKVRVGFKFHQERLLELKNRAIIEKLLQELTGQNLRLSCAIDRESRQKHQESLRAKDDQLLNAAMEVFDIEK